MQIRKRNNNLLEEFDKEKIVKALSKANACVNINERLSDDEISTIVNSIETICAGISAISSVEDIQDYVENEIMRMGKYKLAKEYITYRWRRAECRKQNSTDDAILSVLRNQNQEINRENANKNPTILSTKRDYMAGIVSKDLSEKYFIPKDIWKAHKDGIIHFHDTDYFAMNMYNCCLVNLDDMLQNNTCISETLIEKPHAFSTACTIASQIVAQVASSQYGGQTISAYHLAKFVDVSRKTLRKYFEKEFEESGISYTEEQMNAFVELETRRDIKNGVQTLQYQLITLLTSNGQTPFVSLCLYLNEAQNEKEKADLALVIEEVLRQRIKGVKNRVGTYYANPFPKLLYILEEDNIHEDSKYWYLTKIAAECTTKRMVPDYISEKVMMKIKRDNNGGHAFPCMGCRSFLSAYIDQESGNSKFYGRFNKGVVSINLMDVALASGKDLEKFWEILDSRLELCHRALRLRHDHLIGVKAEEAPILWRDGAIARLDKDEVIDKYLYNGYSTLSLGYAGLYEAVKYITGKSHTDNGEGFDLAKKIMDLLNEKCSVWDSNEHIGYSVYGTPIESTTAKFADKCRERYGVIEGITDRGYVTNSYHVPVFEEIDAFSKIELESKFQPLSSGGAISYIETANMCNNVEAIISVIKFIYEHTMYCEINTKLDTCQECGYEGTIEMVKNTDGEYIWRCPKCGNTKKGTMNIIRRVCGYMSNANEMNQGRMGDIHDRVLHM